MSSEAHHRLEAFDTLKIEDGVPAEHWAMIEHEVAKPSAKSGIMIFRNMFLD
jgi:predicted SnoaL-like aldol condensation-catalyzing enzyme